MIVYLARDILPFVMYCVNGKPRSSLLIESTDSMICDPLHENQPYGTKISVFGGFRSFNLRRTDRSKFDTNPTCTHRAMPVFMSTGQTTRFRETAILVTFKEKKNMDIKL